MSMATEIDLLESLSSRKVDRAERFEVRRRLTQAQRNEICQFDQEYFDGPTGYGGYYYDGRHEPAVRQMIEYYGLEPKSRVLDVGCAKGFMLYEFVRLGIEDVRGCDVSAYAVEHAHPAVKSRLAVMNAEGLDFPDASIDLVYSIDVIHNLPPESCDGSIREIMRVSRGGAFIQVATYGTPQEKRNLIDWGVTVKTFRSKQEWREAFERLGYEGEFYFKTF